MDLYKSAKPRNQINVNHVGEYLESPHDMMLERGNSVLLHWQGPEYEHYPKEKLWYAVATLILSAIIIYALVSNSPIMAITFVLIGVVGYVQLEKFPRVLDFKVTIDGMIVGNELYKFNSIKSFWIFYEPPHTKILSLHTDAFLTPYIHIPVHQIDPVKLREVLLDFVPEVEQEQSFIDTLERLLHI
jgi:positive regulator of sigma E activity